MKIAYFSDTFFPKIDGVVISLINLVEALGKRGHRIAIFCPHPGRGKKINWSARNVELITITSLPALIYPQVRLATPTPKSFIQLRRWKPDIIHLQSPASVGMQGLLTAKLLGLPLVGTFHTYFMEPEYLRLVRLDKYKRVSKALWSYAVSFFGKCDAVVVPSKKAKEELINHGLKNSIDIIFNSVNLSSINKSRTKSANEIRKQYGLKKFVVLYVGRLSKEKNLDFLIRAFAKVIEKISEAQLVIIGDGPIRKQLEIMVQERGMSGAVLFMGKIEHGELISSGFHRAATMFCTASTSEVQPMSIIEAMAFGLPIIGAKARGLLDLIIGNGILVEPNDELALSEAILKIINSPSILKKYSLQSMKLAENYSVDRVTDRYEKLYYALSKDRKRMNLRVSLRNKLEKVLNERIRLIKTLRKLELGDIISDI